MRQRGGVDGECERNEEERSKSFFSNDDDASRLTAFFSRVGQTLKNNSNYSKLNRVHNNLKIFRSPFRALVIPQFMSGNYF